ncbi:MAG: class I SAM-dependent methyltransferase [Candidatus Heimdallarchaeota archaeon]
MAKQQENQQELLLSKKVTKESYNRMSKWYDAFSIFEKRYKKIGLKLLDSKLGESILEIGFGTGDSIISIAKKVGFDGSVNGIDISDGMIEKTRRKIKRKKVGQPIHILCGDASSLPYKRSAFDKILISFTIELFNLEEIPVVLSESSRVLQNKGLICVVTLSKRKTNYIVKIYEWFHRKYPNLIDCRPIYIRDHLKNANFVIMDIKEMNMWGLPVDVILAKKT